MINYLIQTTCEYDDHNKFIDKKLEMCGKA